MQGLQNMRAGLRALLHPPSRSSSMRLPGTAIYSRFAGRRQTNFRHFAIRQEHAAILRGFSTRNTTGGAEREPPTSLRAALTMKRQRPHVMKSRSELEREKSLKMSFAWRTAAVCVVGLFGGCMIFAWWYLKKERLTGADKFAKSLDEINQQQVLKKLESLEELSDETPKGATSRLSSTSSSTKGAHKSRGSNFIAAPEKSTEDEHVYVFMDISVDGDPQGRIVFRLHPHVAPSAVENFRALCTGEYGIGYAGSPFHRIVKNYVLQGGDITRGDGTGGESIYGVDFDDEITSALPHAPYALAMANQGEPNTNMSQFYICATHAQWLDGNDVVFGEVVKGKQVLRKLNDLGSRDGSLQNKIIIENSGALIPVEPT